MFIAAPLSLLFGQSLNAQSLVTYLDGGTTFDASATALGVTATAIDNQADTGNPIRNDFGASGANIYTGNGDHAISLFDSSSPNDEFLGFTLSAADADTSLNLTNITFEFGVGLNDGPNDMIGDGIPALALGSAYGYTLFASTDGGGTFTDLGNESFNTLTQLEELTGESQTANVDLTGLGPIASGNSVEFRIVNFVNDGDTNRIGATAAGQIAVTLANVNVNGAVVTAVPEPGSMILFAFLAPMACLRRKRL